MPRTTAHAHYPTGGNRLLGLLPADVRSQLEADLDPVRVAFKEPLYEPHRPIDYVFFPVDGVVSIVAVLEEGGPVEIATVGNEGMLGLPVFLGGRSIPSRVFCQIEGEALRMRAERFREHVRRHEPLREVLGRYTQALFNFVAQSAACNRVHPVQKRCARWMLTTHDRIGRETFPLTQEFLAQMLGTRRAAVNSAASALQQAGFIRYQRGQITVSDRRGLERSTCECYAVIRREFDRLLT
ncbi:MAG: Crp/Fnr family transcriptional regulator [Chloroflexota bacterium]|nr:Crp/Fnr family transcriptional regulator [Actinomycetota bacterium]MDQ6672302.1 Crp/Fnr family transcriptional regulator [Chloroflexota bacterium]